MQYDMFEVEQNLRDAWRNTTSLQRYKGAAWYPQAHNFAYVISDGDILKGAGVLAATSPNKAWNDNRRIAVDVFHGIYGGQVTNALDKARKIMAGFHPVEVLPMHKKTGNFFQNILDPNDDGFVTIDRHAIRVATSEWDNGEPRITEKQYGQFALAFKNVAQSVGVLVTVFQAALWIYARERVGRS